MPPTARAAPPTILTALARLLRSRRRILAPLLSAAVVVTPACGVHGLSFKEDTRVDIVSPADRAEVRLPLTVRWTVRDYDVGPRRGSFGLLVDHAPPPSGKTLSWLFRGDPTCRGDTGKKLCRTEEFLSSRQVFTTTDTKFTVRLVPRRSGDDRRRQFHEFTIVLLDDTGRRTGEGAWSVQFEVDRER